MRTIQPTFKISNAPIPIFFYVGFEISAKPTWTALIISKGERGWLAGFEFEIQNLFGPGFEFEIEDPLGPCPAHPQAVPSLKSQGLPKSVSCQDLCNGLGYKLCSCRNL